MAQQIHLLLVFGIALSAMIGCRDNRPPTYPAGGTVKFEDGNPVRMGFISFIPTKGGPSARGKLDTNGQFTLGTYTNNDGAIEGEHIVIITQPTVPIDPKIARTLGPEHQEHASSKYIISRKYSSQERSDLRSNVSSTEKNYLELTVKSISENEFRQGMKQQQR